ncbi:MAG: hypothetical protein E6Q93_26765 [Burkholderiaceae bacterium]|nr:MAG: hypothetical protein E6Q93_26765 [Burkholderiaceae bacterium]
MKSQRGGFALGLIVGLLIGLALALAVALYVTEVPGPFGNKVPQRTAEHGADGAKDKLAAAGVESALVRVQK